MKAIYKLIVLCLVLCILSSCSESYKVDYMPVKTDKNEQWGFINQKGEVFLEDEFENEPSEVIDGVFSVKEDETYSLYHFDEKKPKLIMSDLVYVGVPNGGMLPITKKDGKIEVVDLNGKTLFTLDKIDGKSVSKCDEKFYYDYLCVYVIDGKGIKTAIIDRKGDVVIKPKYDRVRALSEDLFFVKDEKSSDDSEAFIVNKEGEKQRNWKVDSESTAGRYGDYVVITRDDRCRIYDLKGNELLKCKEEVEDIWEIKNGFIVVVNEDYEKGVITIEGEKVLGIKFKDVVVTDDGFLAKREGKEHYEFYNKNGERENETDWTVVCDVYGFGLLATEEEDEDIVRYQYIVDTKGEEIHKTDMYDISFGPWVLYVKSDYFDASEICDIVYDGIDHYVGDSGVELEGLVSSCILDRTEIYNDGCSYFYSNGVKYNINLLLVSNENMKVPVYKERPVQRYDYWYGYYTAYERYIDHYETNPDAHILMYAFAIETPGEKRNKLYEVLCDRFASKCSAQSEGSYVMGNKNILVQKHNTDIVYVMVSHEDLDGYKNDNYRDYDEAEEAVVEEAPVEY